MSLNPKAALMVAIFLLSHRNEILSPHGQHDNTVQLSPGPMLRKSRVHFYLTNYIFFFLYPHNYDIMTEQKHR